MFWVWVGIGWLASIVLVVLFFYGAFAKTREEEEIRRRLAALIRDLQEREGDWR